MYQQMLAAGEYSSAAEYDILLALARDEFEAKVAREEYEKEAAQEENAKQCCNPFPCPYNGKNGKSCD